MLHLLAFATLPKGGARRSGIQIHNSAFNFQKLNADSRFEKMRK
jgi:hypothetical protein